MVASTGSAQRSKNGGGSIGGRKARLRLIVIQALVFSLFATLFARLYYLQVVSGAEYEAQAASQSVREIVVQPQRGLIVDDQGRPLVTNRPSWVISVDRTMLGKMSDRQRNLLLARLGRAVGEPCGADRQAAGDLRRPRQHRRHLLERLALPAGARRPRRPAVGRPAHPRAAGGLPRDPGRAGDRAGLPASLRHQPRPRAGLPQPDHRVRVRRRPGQRRPLRQRRLVGGPRRRREAVRRVAARDARLPQRRGGLDGPGARRRQRARRAAGRHAGHLDRRQGPGGRGAAARPDHRDRPAHPRPGERPALRRRLRCRRGPGGRHRPDRGHGQPADVRPLGVGGRHQREAAPAALLRPGPGPRC